MGLYRAISHDGNSSEAVHLCSGVARRSNTQSPPTFHMGAPLCQGVFVCWCVCVCMSEREMQLRPSQLNGSDIGGASHTYPPTSSTLNKHNKCNVLESCQNRSLLPVPGKYFFHKLIPGAKTERTFELKDVNIQAVH